MKTTTTLGSMVIDELIIPITEIRFQNGLIQVHGDIRGPLPAVNTSNWTVHDQDGGLVTRVLNCPLQWGEIDAFQNLHVVGYISVLNKIAQGDGKYLT